VGGGTIGAGIAVSFLAVGDTVMVVEMNEGAHATVADDAKDSLTRLARRNTSLDVDEAMNRLSVSSEHPAPDDVVLVIEAIPEDLGLKQRVFAQLETHYGPSTMLASNTSSLPISGVASALDHPDRCLGLHFFNPVPISSLVEIVVGEATADERVAEAQSWVEHVGKTPIVVKDSPGFASSRLGLVLGLEAIRMLESGVASAEDIDTAMELGYRHPMGPLKLTDLVGLDVRLSIAEHLASELGDRFEPPALLRQMVEDGKLGKKSGQGFYSW
ncbi:MAG: 3-hydroxyacyl-CoA dehydrogenase family protein, partial [Acidimicrobiia bacterium]|nr:3-hydroxyacyl-CoA dehydrogenase family protein [Acidimicrobiia bacterium]